jgi:hypothetical protein
MAVPASLPLRVSSGFAPDSLTPDRGESTSIRNDSGRRLGADRSASRPALAAGASLEENRHSLAQVLAGGISAPAGRLAAVRASELVEEFFEAVEEHRGVEQLLLQDVDLRRLCSVLASSCVESLVGVRLENDDLDPVDGRSRRRPAAAHGLVIKGEAITRIGAGIVRGFCRVRAESVLAA